MANEEKLRHKSLKLAIKYLSAYGPLHRDMVVTWAQQFELYLSTGQNAKIETENNFNNQTANYGEKLH